MNGDDVVGLVRGFLHAGADHVLPALWEIDDAATSNLMTDFYRQIIADKGKPESLRQSQLAMRTQRENLWDGLGG